MSRDLREICEELKFQGLKDMGYRITSRKYGMISRIDRPDWKEHMAAQHAPWDPTGVGMKWVQCLSSQRGGAEDHYRRCYSLDTQELGTVVIGKIPPSNWDPVGYVPV